MHINCKTLCTYYVGIYISYLLEVIPRLLDICIFIKKRYTPTRTFPENECYSYNAYLCREERSERSSLTHSTTRKLKYFTRTDKGHWIGINHCLCLYFLFEFEFYFFSRLYSENVALATDGQLIHVLVYILHCKAKDHEQTGSAHGKVLPYFRAQWTTVRGKQDPSILEYILAYDLPETNISQYDTLGSFTS